MRGHVTIAGLRDRHRREERRLLLGALVRNEWSLAATAADVEVAVSTLQHLIREHDLSELYQQHVGKRGRGRPRLTR